MNGIRTKTENGMSRRRSFVVRRSYPRQRHLPVKLSTHLTPLPPRECPPIEHLPLDLRRDLDLLTQQPRPRPVVRRLLLHHSPCPRAQTPDRLLLPLDDLMCLFVREVGNLWRGRTDRDWRERRR